MRNFLGSIFFIALLSVVGLWTYLALDPPTGSEITEEFNVVPAQRQRSSEAPDGSVAQRLSKIEFLISGFENSSRDKLSAEERIQMARDLNLAYFDSRSELLKKRISDALTRALHDETDQQVARAIAFSHSRLPFDENTLINLKSAYGRKVISFDDYYGELAHLYKDTPPSTRMDVIKEISESHNRYAVDIIAGGIAFEENIQLSQDEVSELQRFLTVNEPIFSGSADAFGYFEAILYMNWLLANSRLAKEVGEISLEQFLGNKLLDPKTDPRASVAFLVSGYAKNIDESQKDAIQWDAVQMRAREFVRQNQNSSGLREIGKGMTK